MNVRSLPAETSTIGALPYDRLGTRIKHRGIEPWQPRASEAEAPPGTAPLAHVTAPAMFLPDHVTTCFELFVRPTKVHGLERSGLGCRLKHLAMQPIRNGVIGATMGGLSFR